MESVPCPQCGNEPTQPLIYGYASEEELELFEAGLWCYAGPMPEGEMPSHRCPECDYFWTVTQPLPMKRPLIRKCHFCDSALTERERQSFEQAVGEFYRFWRDSDSDDSIPIEFEHHPFPICEACQAGIRENQAEMTFDQEQQQQLQRKVINFLLALFFALIASLILLGSRGMLK